METISRRTALRRIGLIVGGTLAAPTVAGVMSGCQADPSPSWSPTTMSVDQDAVVTTISEHIIPATDTPGAADAQVNRFIDKMMTEWYPDEDRQAFVDGLQAANQWCEQMLGSAFADCSADEQVAFLTRLDEATFAPPPAPEELETDSGDEIPEASEESLRDGSSDGAEQVEAAVDTMSEQALAATDREAAQAFWRRMKELTLVGYYTSEVGATEELRWNPTPGRYDGCIPFEEVGRTWA